MPTETPLSTSVTTRDSKGRKAVENFEAAYNKARLDERAAQRLNESRAFAVYLAEGIRLFSHETPAELKAIFKEGPLLEPVEGLPASLLRVGFEWRNRQGLVVMGVRPNIDSQAVAPLRGFRLLRKAHEVAITDEIGGDYESTRAHIAAALEAQWHGDKGGPLNVDGRSNLFFAEERVFHVTRNDGRWVIAEQRESLRDPWHPGTRVFVP